MKFKKFASLALAAAMVITPFVFSSCADNDGKRNDDGNEELAMLPSTFGGERKDFDGAKFLVLTKQDRGQTQAFNIVDLIGGETNIGDEGIKTAVTERNNRLEAVFDVVIDRKPDKDVGGTARSAIQKRDDSYQAFIMSVEAGLKLATEGTLVDYASTGYLDLQGSYWDTAIMENLLLLDGAYIAMGDINTVDDDGCWCVLFNKELYKQFNNGNEAAILYDQVKSGVGTTGGWTLESLKSYAENGFIADTNDPNKYLESYNGLGTYGVITQRELSTVLLQSGGYTPTIATGSGYGYQNNMTSDFADACEVIFDFMGGSDKNQWLLNMDNVTGFGEEYDIWDKIARGGFKRDMALFFMCHVGTINLIRDMETEFGILPVPKLTSDQLDYANTIQYGNSLCYVVPSFSEEADYNATYVLEAMGYYSGTSYFEALAESNGKEFNPKKDDKSLRYAFRVNLLENRATRDDESMEMLQYVFDNRVFDIACALNLEQLNLKLWNVCTSTTSLNFGSEIGAMPNLEDLIEKQLKQLNQIKYGE